MTSSVGSASVPDLVVDRLQVTHPTDDDNVYFIGDQHGCDRDQLDTRPRRAATVPYREWRPPPDLGHRTGSSDHLHLAGAKPPGHPATPRSLPGLKPSGKRPGPTTPIGPICSSRPGVPCLPGPGHSPGPPGSPAHGGRTGLRYPAPDSGEETGLLITLPALRERKHPYCGSGRSTPERGRGVVAGRPGAGETFVIDRPDWAAAGPVVCSQPQVNPGSSPLSTRTPSVGRRRGQARGSMLTA